MPSLSSLSRSTAFILQAPLFHQHAQLSKATIHLLPLPHQLSTSSDIGIFTMASEAVSLANVPAEAARDALQLAHALAEVDPFLFISTLRYGQHENCLREGKQRRWRRKGVELDVGGKDNVEGRGLAESCLSKVERLRYLTRDQEAEFSSCLKHRLIP